MNNNVSRYISANESDLYTAIARAVNKKNIINVGIITKVIDDNFVNVKLYCSDTEGKPIIVSSVRLFHIGTAKCKINIQPAVGDNVLLLGCRDFIEKLEYQHQPKEKEATIEPYNNTTIQGILISPEENDNIKTTININENGDISVTTAGEVSVASDKTISFDGNNFGGLCKTQELKSQLDILSGRLDSVINGINNAVPMPEDGGVALQKGIKATIKAYEEEHGKEDFSNIESDKVLHGDNSSS